MPAGCGRAVRPAPGRDHQNDRRNLIRPRAGGPSQARGAQRRVSAARRALQRARSPHGIALIETGRVAEGDRLIERTMPARRLRRPDQAGFARILLAEVYIQILAGGRKAAAGPSSRTPDPGDSAVSRRAPRRRASGSCGVTHTVQPSRGRRRPHRFRRGQLFAMRGKRSQARACFERARETSRRAQGSTHCASERSTRWPGWPSPGI